ncbi:MAG: DUF357 domain-containing protein [Candidatus Diapherotrites archaeon]|nr:DUF357 domain-containing protein [Candidatus Diapherotrites archaeon]
MKKIKKQNLENELSKRTEKYRKLTEKALKVIKIEQGLSEKEQRIAEDFLSMAKNYLEDGKYYEKKGELLIAVCSYSYAHAWLDAGVRARIFKAKDNMLFTLPE